MLGTYTVQTTPRDVENEFILSVTGIAVTLTDINSYVEFYVSLAPVQ